MRWHRNPFFHTAVLPPSVAPSAQPSARPSADLETATAAAAAAARESTQADAPPRISTDSKSGALADPPPGFLNEAATRAAAHQHHARFSFMSRRRAAPPTIPRLTILEPSDYLTPYQIFYIFVIDGLGAFILSGAINFAIAYAMYKTIDSDRHPIRLFRFPNTLAGDAAVTIFLQCVITWFIELVLVNRDLRTGHIQPIGFMPEPSWPLVRWFVLLDRLPTGRAAKQAETETETGPGTSSGTDDDGTLQRPLSAPHDDNCHCHEHAEPYAPGSLRHWLYFLVSQLVRALLTGVASFLVLWGPAIGIMTAVGDYHDGDWWFSAASWAPPVFKLVYGGVLALLTTPAFVAFWLVRCGWALRANERHLEEGLRRRNGNGNGSGTGNGGAESETPVNRASLMIPRSLLPEAGIDEE